MYKQNFKNQAVKEVKNGSSVAAVARKFDVSASTITLWSKEYDKKMYEIMRDEQEPPVDKPIARGIKLKSIKVIINGAAVTLSRKDVLKLLDLFNALEKE